MESSLEDIMRGAHRALTGTRGAAATLCMIRDGGMEACAVGNVELRSGDLRIPLVTSPGILGTRVAKFRTCVQRITKPGRLILFSDGISSRVRFEELSHLEPQAFCEQILVEHRRDYDDSTILVADLELHA